MHDELQAFELIPSPVYWSNEFEQANAKAGSLPVWSELDLRVRQRGTQILGGRQWPGCVSLPSDIVLLLLESELLQTPTSMSALSLSHKAQFISLLHAWQAHGLHYEFEKLGSSIVVNGDVHCSITSKTFSLMPSSAFYVDLQCHDPASKHMPFGALVGLDSDAAQNLYLLVALDYGQTVEVMNLPLDGSLFSQSIEKAGLGIFSPQLHSVVSAVLLCSSNRGAVDSVNPLSPDAISESKLRKLKISGSFDPSMTKAYDEIVRELDGTSVFVQAQWTEPEESSVANLQLTLNEQKEFADRSVLDQLLQRLHNTKT